MKQADHHDIARPSLELVWLYLGTNVEMPTQRIHVRFELNWTDSTRVHGCQSEAHVKVEIIDSSVHFYSGADSKLVQGLMGILTMAIHGIEVESALTLSPEFAAEMGILNSLSPSRSNGFRNMFDKVMNEIRHHA